MAGWRSALASLALTLQLSTAVLAADPTGPGPAVANSYLVQAGDTLVVSVWREPEVSGEVLVRPDGGMSVPLAGEVQASGHTCEELRNTLQSRFVKYIPDPVVTVLVRKPDGSRIFVVGKVNHPGDFPLTRPTDVMQALSIAGGATPFADVNDIRVLRREGEHQQVFRFRYDDVRRGRDLGQNILLHSGDTVVVP
jgi:polysaccharide biosynthesis/export protein